MEGPKRDITKDCNLMQSGAIILYRERGRLALGVVEGDLGERG